MPTSFYVSFCETHLASVVGFAALNPPYAVTSAAR
jgi:hypothetical protein